MSKRNVLAIFIILVGILIAGFPIKLAIESRLEQKKLKQEFSNKKIESNTDKEVEKEVVYTSWPETRMSIPKISLDVIVIEMDQGEGDIFAEDVNYPPAHYVSTDFPGGKSNVAIAGHRTGPADYFRHLDELEEGDEIILETPEASHEYIVEEVFITDPENSSVIRPTDYAALTLTTCQAQDGVSNKKRLIVRAKLKQ